MVAHSVSNVLRRLGNATCAAFGLLAVAPADQGHSEDTKSIAVSCKPSKTVDQSAAKTVCPEILDYLSSHFSRFTFTGDGMGAERINLLISNFSKTSLEIGVTWVKADGTATSQSPMRFVMYDREIDKFSRRGFYKKFFEQNPIPF